MQTKKRLLIPAPSENDAILMTRTTYLSSTGTSLLQEYAALTASDTFGKFYARQSSDNGNTWSEPILIFEPVRIPEGMLRRGEFTLLLDEKRNRVIRIYNLSIYPALETHTIAVIRTHRLWFEISEDAGKTFSEPRQLIVKGYNKTQWAPDVCYGKNSSPISFCQPFVDDAGRIVLPAFWKPELPEDHTGPYAMEALCYFGETETDGSITWTVSERVAIEKARSVRGLGEPTIAPLASRKLLMLCRGSNVQQPEMPARRWMTTSTDGGLHWSEVKPFGYDTGESFYSPATGSHLIRSSRNGKLYWIGNISPHNPNGNYPRYPLCIGEVDEETETLRKDTVENIDTRQPEDTPKVQLSNFHVYEDRVTREFVLIMSRIFEHSETSLVSPAYEYRISL